MPAQSFSKVETLLLNTHTAARYFGYGGPKRGVELAAGGTAVIPGDIRRKMSQRELDALERDRIAGLIAYFVHQRVIIMPAVDSATVIAVGDVLWLDTDDVKPAADFSAGTSSDATRVSFANAAIGIALEASANAETDPIQVDISPNSVHFFDCTSETHEVGDLMGCDDGAANAILSDTLQVVGAAAEATFRCVRRDASAATKVLVNFQSAYWGHNAAAAQ